MHTSFITIPPNPYPASRILPWFVELPWCLWMVSRRTREPLSRSMRLKTSRFESGALSRRAQSGLFHPPLQQLGTAGLPYSSWGTFRSSLLRSLPSHPSYEARRSHFSGKSSAFSTFVLPSLANEQLGSGHEDRMAQSASFWHEVRYELAHLRGARKGDEVYPSRLELALLAMDASSG